MEVNQSGLYKTCICLLAGRILDSQQAAAKNWCRILPLVLTQFWHTFDSPKHYMSTTGKCMKFMLLRCDSWGPNFIVKAITWSETESIMWHLPWWHVSNSFKYVVISTYGHKFTHPFIEIELWNWFSRFLTWIFAFLLQLPNSFQYFPTTELRRNKFCPTGVLINK
jgi:hypothetical protein